MKQEKNEMNGWRLPTDIPHYMDDMRHLVMIDSPDGEDLQLMVAVLYGHPELSPHPDEAGWVLYDHFEGDWRNISHLVLCWMLEPEPPGKSFFRTLKN